MTIFFRWVLFCVLNFFVVGAFAQAVKATIIGETPYVYEKPDFDSKILAEVEPGKVFDVSKSKKNGFHKIRVRPGMVGWIPDSEIRLGSHKIKSEEDAVSDVEEKRMDKARKSNSLPINMARYRGLSFESILFTEQTAGRERSAALPFYGLKISGPDTLFSGMLPTEMSFIFSPQAPNYYKDITLNSASGYVFLAQFQFVTNFSTGKNYLAFYGFGPVLKYSHFDLKLGSGGAQKKYSADDMTLGASFNLGAAYRMGAFALRPELKYYWEKTKYVGFGLSAQWAF